MIKCESNTVIGTKAELKHGVLLELIALLDDEDKPYELNYSATAIMPGRHRIYLRYHYDNSVHFAEILLEANRRAAEKLKSENKL